MKGTPPRKLLPLVCTRAPLLPRAKWKACPLRHVSWTLRPGVCLSSRGQKALWCPVSPPAPPRPYLSCAHGAWVPASGRPWRVGLWCRSLSFLLCLNKVWELNVCVSLPDSGHGLWGRGGRPRCPHGSLKNKVAPACAPVLRLDGRFGRWSLSRCETREKTPVALRTAHWLCIPGDGQEHGVARATAFPLTPPL